MNIMANSTFNIVYTVITINYDFSTPVSTFKLNLKNLLFKTQHKTTELEWTGANSLLHNY